MRKFIVYLDDGRDCYKIAVPAKDKKEAVKFCEGNGEVISVKDVTDDVPISLDYVSNALTHAGFGQIEIDFILRTLSKCNIAE